MTTQWKDSLLPGSFRGVPFFVSSATASGGRRVTTKTFPERDDPEWQDMGLSPRTFSLSVYFLGDKAFKTRDQMIAAIETRGPGKLVHPFRGEIQVIAKTYSFNESDAEALIIRGDIEFEQYNAKVSKVVVDTRTKVFRKKKSLLEKIIGAMDKAYNTARKPITALEKARDTLDAGLDVVAKAKQITGLNAEFTRTLREIRGRADALTLNGAAMAQDVSALINFGTDFENYDVFTPTIDNAAAQRREMQRLREAVAGPLVANSGDLGSQIQNMMTLSALAGEIGLLTLVDFDSPEAAIEAEQSLIAAMDAALTSPDDELYAAIRDTLAELHADLDARAITLPRLAELVIVNTRNLLELTTEVYGTPDALDDLTRLNGIIHPGFVSAAVPLRVRVEA